MQRAHDALSAPNLQKCSNCDAPKAPHRICPACGYYAGKAVLEVSAD